MNLIKKMTQCGDTPPALAPLRDICSAWAGGVIAIAVVAYLAHSTGYPLVLGSFGASCVLLFGFPDSPFSQPRNVIGGHLLSSFIGILLLILLGSYWWSMALAAGTCIAAMMITKTVHPPAGSNPVIVMLSAPSWGFLITPTFFGSIILVVVALVFNNLTRARNYPRYW